MKKIVLLIVLSISLIANAQQWINKKYAYDSTLNVTYGTAINFNGVIDTLKMDIYTPICDDATHTSKKPLMVWIHGGAFLAGDKNDASITKLCKQFAKRGYVTASIDYRLGFISDDAAWTCSYPGYSCVFAADSAEWMRAWYRSVQDAKGALRYLINRNSQYRIDVNNVFVSGESAGALVALGVGLLDTIIERMPQTFAIGAVPKPNTNTSTCPYNANKTFTNTMVSRPDLGGIDGIIEPTTINYTIKGIGNNYGAMMSNLLKYNKLGHPKPAIYSFHQPCDMVVPIDSGGVYAGLSWCMTNGYGCYGIANTAKLYGSRAFSNWNTNNSYGYIIHNEFTATNFPYSYLFGQGSCADQINNPCHAYDNAVLRENNLAAYFAPLVSTNPVCDTTSFITNMIDLKNANELQIYPNPTHDKLMIHLKNYEEGKLNITTILGVNVKNINLKNESTEIDLSDFASGIYYITFIDKSKQTITKKIVKQ